MELLVLLVDGTAKISCPLRSLYPFRRPPRSLRRLRGGDSDDGGDAFGDDDGAAEASLTALPTGTRRRIARTRHCHFRSAQFL